jgi:transposase
MSNQMKKYNSDFKLKVVTKYLSGNSTMNQLCQEFNIAKATVHKWVKQFKDNSSSIFSDSSLSSNNQKKKEEKLKEKEISNLYKKIGQLTVERDFLKKVLDT